MIIIPPYLKPGDTIGITCPAGFMPVERTETCVQTLHSWGYNVVIGKTVGSSSTNYFSETDDERLNEMQSMLDDKKIDAILFGRGGYGTTRIIDRINFKRFKKKPKWLIGFSDITALHMHLFSNFGIASIHGPMAGAFHNNNVTPASIASLQDALVGKKAKYNIEGHPLNKKGKSTGKIIGGNLALLTNIISTSSDYDTGNKIFFIEDIGEYLYNADRMLWQLKRSGKFKKPAGVIFGRFTDMKDTERSFGKSIEEICHDITASLKCPVAFNFPISHGNENLAIKIGASYDLQVTGEKVLLKER